MINKNFQAYQRLNLFNQRRFKPGEYLVLVKGKLFLQGKELGEILRAAKSKYPQETPLVAKVPQRGTFVFRFF